MAFIWWGFLYIAATFFLGWWPFSDSGTLPLSKYEDVSVNAYFYYPNDTEVYLGQHRGASACQSAAASFAASKDISGANWSYICCTIENGSACYRKIK